MASLRQLEVLQVVDPCEGVKPLKNKWVLRRKRINDGHIG
jgi:hypothetical protein